MARSVRIAAVQMDANPAPILERLARAERLVTAAAKAGAELVILPELFNTGYTYAEANHRLAETPSGPTVVWMKETAAHLGVHLAGALMLLDRYDVYDSLLLFSPEGRMWRYDKNYPWGWERAYFRDAKRITIAETDLGRLGMLICWDVGHTGLWRRFSGRVDLMVISSCPPNTSDPSFRFPSGKQVTFDDLGPLVASLKGMGQRVFGDMIDQQSAWLGVPAVNSMGSGHIETALPNSLGTLLAFVPAAPRLIRYLPQARRMRMSCDMVPGCKVIDAEGQILAERTQEDGESFALAEVVLPDERPHPRRAQPASPLSPMAYFVSDVLLPSLVIPVYRQGLRRAWGDGMAPASAATRKWALAAGLGVAAGLVAGLFLKHRKS